MSTKEQCNTNMNTLSYTDTIADDAYNEGFKAGKKSMQKKYDNLFYLAHVFFYNYESQFGEPDRDIPDNKEYFQLQRLLNSK
jgi:hypothetical protein